MICASAQAESAKYRKVQGKGRSTWLVPLDNDPYKIHVDMHDPNSEGYAGRTISFNLEDGTEYNAKGPWNSNVDALFQDTGIDLRSTFNIKLRVYDAAKHYEIHDNLRKKHTPCQCFVADCDHGFLEEIEYKNCVYGIDREEVQKFLKKYKKDLRISKFVYRAYTGGFEPACSTPYPFK